MTKTSSRSKRINEIKQNLDDGLSDGILSFKAELRNKVLKELQVKDLDTILVVSSKKYKLVRKECRKGGTISFQSCLGNSEIRKVGKDRYEDEFGNRVVRAGLLQRLGGELSYNNPNTISGSICQFAEDNGVKSFNTMSEMVDSYVGDLSTKLREVA